jgi:hypothetical protein
MASRALSLKFEDIVRLAASYDVPVEDAMLIAVNVNIQVSARAC